MEGEILKRQAEEDLEEKKHKDLQRKRQEIENAQAIRLANLDIQLQHKKMAQKEAEEDALRELKMKQKEEQMKKIQEVLDRKKKEKLDLLDNMYQKGLDRLNKEQKEDPTDGLRIKHIEEAEAKAYRKWEENEAKRQ